MQNYDKLRRIKDFPDGEGRGTPTPKGLFTRTVSVSVTVKVYHCVNGNGPFDRQNGFCTDSAHQMERHHRRNVIL